MEKGSGIARLKRPEVERVAVTDTYGKFNVAPLERGFGTTVGNSLRRVLLSSIEGAAVTSLRIEGVDHEFDTLPGVKEDVADVILNIKKLQLRLEDGEEQTVIRLDVRGARDLSARDIETGPYVEVMNPELHIATLNEDGKFVAEMTVKAGRGYSPAERNKEEGAPLGVIPVDAIFTPIERVNYHVENARVGQATDYDRLILEVWTNGGIHPEDAVERAAQILRDQLAIFTTEEEEVAPAGEGGGLSEEALRNLGRNVGELDLSVRAMNCLKNAELATIRDLVLRSESEMLKTKNFGRKSLSEIKEVLKNMGLRLGMKAEDLQPRGDARAEAGAAEEQG